jgi:hypothetical protein
MSSAEQQSHQKTCIEKIRETLEIAWRELPEACSRCEAILLRIALLIVFIYGLYRLVSAVLGGHF